MKNMIKLRRRGGDAAALPSPELVPNGRARASGPAAFKNLAHTHNIIFSVLRLAGLCFLVSLSACRQGESGSTKSSQIYVTTDPENANLFYDSVSYGSTPATITSVAPGTHILVVRKPGYNETRASVSIKAGDRLAMELKLEPLRGLVLVHSVPSGADVEIEGVNIGKTPLFSFDFPPGQNRLQISKPGFVPKSVNVNIEDRTPLKVDVSLSSDSAELTVESSPAGATVTMDSSVVGTTPLNLTDAKTGSHTVEISLKGYLPVKREISMQIGEKQKISSKLIPLPGKLTVLSAPQKARIYLNNQFKAEAPFTVTNIPSGKHVIRAELQGFDPQVQTNQVTFGEETFVEFRLVKSSGTMIISTLPTEVDIYLDGELRGTTKTREKEQISDQLQIDFIPRGSHQLQFTKKGYIDIQRTVDIMPKQNLVIHEKLSLRPVPFIPNVIIRTGDRPEQTFRGIVRDTFANGDLKVEIGPGVLKMFSKSEIISMEDIPPAGGQKKP
jgi:hypothetical protein